VKPLRILVTAGPTREWIDPIRYLSNRSSGKMGYALARAAKRLGAVTLVTGPVALRPPAGMEVIPVTTAAEMARAVLRRYSRVDLVIMTAAVCDFRPRTPARRKIKKQTFAGHLELVPTADILAALGRRKRRQILVGFAAETNGVEHYAQDKLRRKNLDLIVANDARAFEADTNRVTLFYRDGRREKFPAMTKARVAAAMIRRIRTIVDAR
jgi:phosphopantothenoylcysteine decarboxylase/phosphopantothenate--cysteine ligase